MDRARAIVSPPLTRGEAHIRTSRTLHGAGIETPELDARLLLCHAGSFSHEALVLDPNEPLAPSQWRRLEAFIRRRQQGEPVSRIIGKRAFWKHEFDLGPETLDPRPDTETLVEATLAIIAAERDRMSLPLIADLGTGTGCVLLSVLDECPQAAGIGIDLSQAALEVAARNAARLGLSHRAAFIAADWLDGIKGPFDIVVSNPPYIRSNAIASLKPEVSRFDPQRALDGGDDGFSAYRSIIRSLPRVLKVGGWAIFEVGENQAVTVNTLLMDNGFACDHPSLCVRRDLYGCLRIVSGTLRN